MGIYHLTLTQTKSKCCHFRQVLSFYFKSSTFTYSSDTI